MKLVDTAITTVKKHKYVAAGVGALLLLHLMRKSASASSPLKMPIGPTRAELTQLSGPLGSL